MNRNFDANDRIVSGQVDEWMEAEVSGVGDLRFAASM